MPARSPTPRRTPPAARTRAAGSKASPRSGKPAAPAAATRGTGAAARAAQGAAAWLAALPEPRRTEVARLDGLIRETVPELRPVVAGAMLGYGPFHYRYASGREGDTVKIGLASRAQAISLYVCAADGRGHVAERYRDRLPAADIGKGCVRFRRLDDLDPVALRELLLEAARTGYGEGG